MRIFFEFDKVFIVKITNLNIDDVITIEPDLFLDKRGFFYESFNFAKFCSVIKGDISFVFDCESLSKKGTIRGLHYQKKPFEQGKLVRVVQGAVYDVIVDLRMHSRTFGFKDMVTLSAENKKILWIPPGLAHGFQALEETTKMQYKITNFYEKSSEVTIKYNDPNLKIEWPILDPIFMSEKDLKGLSFNEFIKIQKKND